MDHSKKQILEKYRSSIVKDLEVEYIIDKLLENSVLNYNEKQTIDKEPFQEEKTKIFLNILMNKGNCAFDTFIKLLQQDYDWLHNALIQVYNTDNDEDEKSFQDAIVLGDLPRLPPNYIERTRTLEEIRNHLIKMQSDGRIVLHGLTGSGKSCLAAAAIREKYLLKKYFNNKVFWMSLGDIKNDEQGDIKNDEQILRHMHRLYHRLKNDMTDGRNTADLPNSVELMKDFLKSLVFKDSVSPLRKSLLILDNVNSPNVVAAFDIGLKAMITTQNKDYVKYEANTVYVPIKCGFTEVETYLLFAKCLETTIDKLKLIPEVKTLSDMCRGEPMLIALIGSLFAPNRERLLYNPKEWNYYINMLSRKDFDKVDKQIFSAIELCIKNLDKELRAKYEDFVVFVEDVNIMPEVLQTMWNIDTDLDVRHIMLELETKSLVVSYYNRNLDKYIYGIHHLLLIYLQKTLSRDDKISRHKKIIKEYKRISNGNFANLPNDNYIFQYIGYHLHESEMFNEFSKMYFDLNFIGAKIKATGIADLLRDFEVYAEYITHKDNSLEKKLQKYKNFVEMYGQDLHKYEDTDVVQCGLQQHKESAIYKAAVDIANQNNNRLYFNLQAAQESHYFTHTLALQDDFRTACFTKSTNEILVGTDSGKIYLWEQKYNQNLCTFNGHHEPIITLQLNATKDGFLSISEDGKVKLWSLVGIGSRRSNGFDFDENGFHPLIPSPRLKQTNHQTFFGTETNIDRSTTFQITDDKIISASYSNKFDESHLIVTGTLKGRVSVWNVFNQEETIITNTMKFPANCVAFSYEDVFVIIAAESLIFLYDLETNQQMAQFRNQVNISSLLIVPTEDEDNCLVALNDSSIKIWSWRHVIRNKQNSVMNLEMKKLYESEDVNFICGAVTDDGMYLVAASTDYYIRMWDIEQRSIVEEFFNRNGLVVSLDTFYEDYNNSVHILLSGLDDNTVKQWHVHPELKVSQSYKKLPVYSVFWGSTTPKLAVANAGDQIQILNEDKVRIETETTKNPIKKVAFSLCGSKLLYGLENGEIYEFHLETKTYHKLMTLHGNIKLLKYFNEDINFIGRSFYVNQDCKPTNKIVVASADNGCLMIYYNYALQLQPPAEVTLLRQLPIIPIVECFYLSKIDKLLTIAENRCIKIWNLLNATYEVLNGGVIYNASYSNITMVTISNCQTMIAITMTDSTFEVYNLVYSDDNRINSTNLYWNTTVDCPLRCCSFSYDNKYLAVGGDNGNITICNLENKTKFAILCSHNTWVRYLQFSPAPEQYLVSVGEQIIWWDINKVPLDIQNRRSFRRRSNSLKKKNLTLAIQQEPTQLDISSWSNKIGKTQKPYLLAAIKLQGLYADFLSSSPDFTSFVTVDNNGEIYIMRLFNSNNI